MKMRWRWTVEPWGSGVLSGETWLRSTAVQRALAMARQHPRGIHNPDPMVMPLPRIKVERT